MSECPRYENVSLHTDKKCGSIVLGKSRGAAAFSHCSLKAASSAFLQYLLSESEIKIKTALWMAENSDYLKEQKGTFRMHLDV